MDEQKQYLRFSLPQRLEHWVLVIAFTVLALTGIPQKFAGADWAESLIGLLGGIELVRTVHHASAVILILAAIYHVVVIAYKVLVLRVQWTMFPRVKDLLDALDAVRYNLGLTKELPKFDRYSFGEKVEYWALVWGTAIMAATGFIMWNPIYATRFVSGEIIPAAKAAHGAEAILAVLAIIIWHFYSVHIKTFSMAMFNGKLTDHQMREEHALELEQIDQGQGDLRPSADIVTRRERLFIPIVAVASVAILAMLFFFVTHQEVALATVPRRSQQVQIYVPLTPTPLVPRTPTPTPLVPQGVTPASSSTQESLPLPADHAGRTTCLACHAKGVGTALPADHAGRTDATCTGCHTASDSTGGVPTGTPTSGAAASSATATSAPSSAAGSALVLPADHAGRTTCTTCHANGVGPALPADHAGRTDTVCLTCHKQP